MATLALVAALLSGLVCGCGGGGGGPTGNVSGRVADEATNLGISDTVVTVGTRTATTDINGLFTVSGISLGAQSLFVSPPPPWIAPDPNPGDGPRIGVINVVAGTTQVGDIIVVIQSPPNPP